MRLYRSVVPSFAPAVVEAVPCAWCLAERDEVFPAERTSTICARHATELRERLRLARARRALASVPLPGME